MRNIPSAAVERDHGTSLPPGGGVAIVIAGSMLFWASILWVALH